MNTVKPLLRSLIIPALFFMGACSSEKSFVEAPPPPPPPKPAPAIVLPGMADLFFDFDKSELRTDGREQLQTNSKWLQANTSKKLIIEGHCDERGTNEYNLALGERRANSAREYLIKLGIEPARINTVSYGEERPFAAGHNEKAWAQNRRDHFVAE